MAYGKRKRSYSSPGSSKRSRSRRRSYGYYRKRRRSSGRKGGLRALNPMRVSRLPMKSPTVGFPQVFLTKLRVRDYAQLQPTTGSGTSYIHLRMNSPYDPYYSFGGQQPRWFDQICGDNLYRKFLVYRTDYKITMRNLKSDHDCLVGVHISPDESSRWQPATQVQMYYDGELNFTQVRILNAAGDGGPKHRTTFAGSIHMAKILGVTKQKLYSDPGYSGTASSDPGNTPILTFAMADDPNDTSGNLIPVDVEVEMVFHCKFFDLAHNIPQS